MTNNKNFLLTFPEVLKRNTTSTTKPLTFDDLGTFIEEREKIKRIAEKYLEAVNSKMANGHYCIFFGLYANALQIDKKQTPKI